MGNVRVHLSAVTRDSLRQLAQIASRIGTVSLTQALRILRTAIEAALRKCKTSARLTFIYWCINGNLFFDSVEHRTARLGLSREVTRTIKVKMMKKIRGDLYCERKDIEMYNIEMYNFSIVDSLPVNNYL